MLESNVEPNTANISHGLNMMCAEKNEPRKLEKHWLFYSVRHSILCLPMQWQMRGYAIIRCKFPVQIVEAILVIPRNLPTFWPHGIIPVLASLKFV